MGHRTVATSTALVTLLLLSVLITASTPAPLVMAEEMAPLPASGRSSTPEVFLASGGTNSHDEFSGAIVASDAGYFVAGDVNSSAQALTFGTHTYIPTSPSQTGTISTSPLSMTPATGTFWLERTTAKAVYPSSPTSLLPPGNPWFRGTCTDPFPLAKPP